MRRSSASRPGIRAHWVLVVVLVFLPLAGAGVAHPITPAAGSPITITPTAPTPGSVVHTEEPNISATWTDSAGTVSSSSVVVSVDGLNVTGLQQLVVTPFGFYYNVPNILKLTPGNAT